MVWLWLKEDKPLWYGLLGGLILAFYGVVATWQPAGFVRTYATYGGIFITLSLLWAWKVDGFIPDKYDLIGAFIALIGVCIIFYTPRG
jgi:small multidrug resistance family-3 protein